MTKEVPAMKALVVYESMFGNTAEVGKAVASALRERGYDARAVPVTDMMPADTARVDLLIVGGPTHAHGMSRAETRRAGASDKRNTYPKPTVAPGLREWMQELPTGLGRFAAAFDTRFAKPAFLTGSAARGIARRLKNAGFVLDTKPESFFVTTQNHLVDGELVHAAEWAVIVGERSAARIEGRAAAA